MLERGRHAARRWLRRAVDGAPDAAPRAAEPKSASSSPPASAPPDDHALMHEELRRSLAELADLLRQVNAAVAPLSSEARRLRDLAADVAAQKEAIGALERRQRRDLGYALDRLATASTAEFVAGNLRTARAFDDPTETLRWALTQAPPDGLALEFGVSTGNTLRIITPTRPRDTVFGFDSFAGLPETWRTDFEAGAFAVDEPPAVPHAELVVGAFKETLPGWVAEHPEPVAFVHVDADLYASTVTVLDHIGDRLVEGSIVVFDEYFNYPGWAEHEHRAWTEFVERTGTEFAYEAYTRTDEQVVVRVIKPGT
jgi:hypothetical protein